jgi:hypothetical protein
MSGSVSALLSRGSTSVKTITAITSSPEMIG